MNSKGMVSFLLVVIFLFNLLSLDSYHAESRKELMKGEEIALEIEKSSFYRNQLETAIDSLIERTVKEEVIKGDTEEEKLKGKINKELMNFFQKIEERFQEKPRISFFLKNNLSSYKIELKEGKKVEEKDLNEIVKLIVFTLDEKIYLVEVSFTGGLMKKKGVFALIELPSVTQLFFIPVDYSKKTVALKVV
ncbi:MAG: hypothetical protein ABIE23_00875 [archaeon]|nr:hypothetical protein [Candidatus Micrarchaeota archaeon]